MHPLLSALLGSSVFDEMLRLIGIAAIVHAVFKGIKSLVVKPSAEVSRQVVAPLAAPLASIAPAPATARDDERLAPEIVAVIAAAITSVIGSNHHIVSIKRQSSTWERAGRQSVLTSHRIR